ncbi:MAG: thymidine phosphorylase [Kosmotogaceae bacterium]|nr:thymidine phosphorylase [Kosmotogaceae bacterium]
MRTYDIIMKKRNGLPNTKEELCSLIRGFVSGDVPDYQMAAWLMAVYFNHLNSEERLYLTEIMIDSGEKIQLSSINGIKVDKHSTGGVGDKVTLVVGPIVAAAGLVFAKLSGRGLGHTGGTIDKLESIPGFVTSLSIEEFEQQSERIGIALAGQTAQVAVADKKLYALRDVTATVDEISLIASSIMSKKLAVDSDGILLDVKIGTGAFMKYLEEARELAVAMIDIGKRKGRTTKAVISDMNQPLGIAVGNALEVVEAIETLKGAGPDDFSHLCRVIASQMLVIGGAANEQEAEEVVNRLIVSGEAVSKFDEFVCAQGGPDGFSEQYDTYFRRAAFVKEVRSSSHGFVRSVDAESIGLVCMRLGAGREKKEDVVDPSVGLEVLKKIGDRVQEGEPIAIIHANNENLIEKEIEAIKKSFVLSEQKSTPPPIVYEVL